MMKLFAFALSAMMALSLTACGTGEVSPSPEESEPTAIGGDPATWGSGADGEESGSVQIPNPFTEYASLEEAAAAAGFSLTVPESVEGCARRVIQVFDTTEEPMIEVIYRNDEDTNDIYIRKAAGSGDISGDHTQYAETSTVAVGELQVTMKGENGQVSLAAWTDAGYAYSIGVRMEGGVSSETMAGLVAAVQ